MYKCMWCVCKSQETMRNRSCQPVSSSAPRYVIHCPEVRVKKVVGTYQVRARQQTHINWINHRYISTEWIIQLCNLPPQLKARDRQTDRQTENQVKESCHFTTYHTTQHLMFNLPPSAHTPHTHSHASYHSQQHSLVFNTQLVQMNWSKAATMLK
jgi:hypothetical protein